MPLIVNEIFYSIQGESTFAGLPCVFIRLTGCNLRCTYCDTAYAYEDGYSMALPEILHTLETLHCHRVEITGGEPLAQPETPVLVSALLRGGYQVLMETNGSYDLDTIDSRCARIMDVKCPGSGEHKKCLLHNLEILGAEDQIKFVIGDKIDYEYAKSILPRIPAHLPPGNVLFSPIKETLTPARLAGWILRDHLDVRLHLQLHRTIWPNLDRGV